MKRINSTYKEPYEEFVLTGDFSTVMSDAESIDVDNSTVEAFNKDGTDVSDTFTYQDTISAVAHELKIRIKGGDAEYSPYKLEFKAVTSLDNKWQINVVVNVEEI